MGSIVAHNIGHFAGFAGDCTMAVANRVVAIGQGVMTIGGAITPERESCEHCTIFTV